MIKATHKFLESDASCLFLLRGKMVVRGRGSKLLCLSLFYEYSAVTATFGFSFHSDMQKGRHNSCCLCLESLRAKIFEKANHTATHVLTSVLCIPLCFLTCLGEEICILICFCLKRDCLSND